MCDIWTPIPGLGWRRGEFFDLHENIVKGKIAPLWGPPLSGDLEGQIGWGRCRDGQIDEWIDRYHPCSPFGLSAAWAALLVAPGVPVSGGPLRCPDEKWLWFLESNSLLWRYETGVDHGDPPLKIYPSGIMAHIHGTKSEGFWETAWCIPRLNKPFCGFGVARLVYI